MRRKSIIAIFATILVLAVSVAVFAACDKNSGEHHFSEGWSVDETHHWHECTNKGCKEIKDKAPHSWNSGSVKVEPTTEKDGEMLYTCLVCHKERTDSIPKLTAEKTYTITFDSKGGSEVQPIKASAGAAITAPSDPTKDGVVFAGWYESEDGGVTLADKAFEFSYMPARVFTLYAKWASADIKGKTFKKVDAIVEWDSEAAKQAILKEMEMTEEDFMKYVGSSKVMFEFAADNNTVTVTFDQAPGEEGPQGRGTLLYRIKGNAIVFYDNQEDMDKEIVAHKYGLLVGSTFELSADKTSIVQTNIQEGLGTTKYIYTIAK